MFYVKIVRNNRNKGDKSKQGEGAENRLYSTNDLSYKKVKVKDKEEMIRVAPKTYILASDIPPEGDFEFLDICLFDPADKTSKNIVAPQCSAFILNQDGRTIDSLHCK